MLQPREAVDAAGACKQPVTLVSGAEGLRCTETARVALSSGVVGMKEIRSQRFQNIEESHCLDSLLSVRPSKEYSV